MIHPFQHILYCEEPHGDDLGLLFAASGCWIYSFSASDGSFISRWSPTTNQHGIGKSFQNQQIDPGENESGRLGKVRKLNETEDASEGTLVEIVVDNADQRSKNQMAEDPPAPAVIKLAVTPNLKHLVAVTGEDKCIRVLRVSADGGLEQLSIRPMPKKPCSITFASDGSMVLCADKFGDVYALPLFVSEMKEKPPFNNMGATSTEETLIAPFVPSANELTVHTKRNQRALKNQQKLTSKVAQKKNLDFEHQLLFGHVSMLTDLACVTLSAEELGTMLPRSYILSSDRDEHIRVSRGVPQTHIIEGYCLEHTEFVSKLCIPAWNRRILVSGGGDEYLVVWDWLNGTVRQNIDLREILLKARQRDDGPPLGTDKQFDVTDRSQSAAVSGIWATVIHGAGKEGHSGVFIVACEGLAALIVFSSNNDGLLEHHETLQTQGNVIDVAILAGHQAILFSMDNLHEPNSTRRMDITGQKPLVGYYSYSCARDNVGKKLGMESIAKAINKWAEGEENLFLNSSSQSSIVSDLLYSISKLRKRGQDDD